MATNFVYKTTKEISKEDLKELYDDNGWALYVRDLEGLQNAVANSLYVLSVWEEDKLIGLVRIVGDGYSIIYVQDILVLQEYHRQGIGTIMMKDVLDKYKHVRQKTLLTDSQPKTIAFYESLGFKKSTDIDCIAFVRHDF